MSFFIVMLVILQVVISFIVDEFKFKLVNTAKEMENNCPKHKRLFKDCRCNRCEYLGSIAAIIYLAVAVAGVHELNAMTNNINLH